MLVLKSASEAVKALTNSHDESSGPAPSVEDRKCAFNSAASDYFRSLSTVDVNLRRQIYALEEANIIPADTTRDAGSTEAGKDKVSQGPGAMGNLDVGWLNSRTDKVGKDMEAELWAQAHELVDRLDLKQLGETGGSVKMEAS